MSCDKRAFASPKAAQGYLRRWQQKGRRSALDNGHVYKADCVEHRGQFHIGRKHDRTQHHVSMLGRSKEAARCMTLLNEVDEVFEQQRRRVNDTLRRVDIRQRARVAQAARDQEGPLCQGDEVDVERR